MKKSSFFVISMLFAIATANASCFKQCLQFPLLGEKHKCLNRCYPEIVKFCDHKQPALPSSPEARTFAVNECVRYAYPCQEKCQSKDKPKEQACRNECLGMN